MASLDKVFNQNFNQILESVGTDEISTLEQLSQIQAKNPPSFAYLPNAEDIYDIDLNTRTINGPSTLSVQRDHRSEVIYFKVDRYYDYMDLANTVCIVEYVVPKDDTRVPYIYVVPYYDTRKLIRENKIVFPWVVGDAATMKHGTLDYAIRFYKIEEHNGQAKLVYNLNTLPTKTEILRGIKESEEIMTVPYDTPIAEKWEHLASQIASSKTVWKIL